MKVEIGNLYEEHISIDELKEKLSSIPCVDFYAFIKHDKDVYENGALKGQVKKVHYHCIIEYNNPDFATLNGSSCKLKLLTILRDNIYNALFINPIRSERVFIRYFVHKDDKDKFQYDISEIVTNDKERVDKCFAKKLKCDKNNDYCINKIFEWIENKTSQITMFEIRDLFKENGSLAYMFQYLNKINDYLLDSGYVKYNSGLNAVYKMED